MTCSIRRLSFLVLLVATLAGCGGRGGPDAAPDATPDAPANPAPPAWLDAERLDLGDSGSARNARLAMNRQGAGMVAWEQVDGSTVQEVHARTVSINGGHGASLSLGTGIAALPDVAINEQGRALVVWVQGASPLNQIWARSYDPDTGWGTAERMSRLEDILVAQPRAAINEAGEMAVVWMQTVDVTYQVHARRFRPTQGWSPAVRLDSAPYDARTPQVSLDAEGRLLSTWYQSDADGRSNLWANHINPDGISVAAVQIDQSTGYSDQPVLALLGDDSTLAVWRQTNEVLLQLIGLNRFLPGSGWVTTTSTSGGNISLARSPALAAWGAAHAVTAWVQSNGSRTEVWANRIEHGQPGQPQALYDGQTLAQDDPCIGADNLGNVIGMWTLRDGDARTLWTTQWPASGAPGIAQRLDNSASASVSESALGVDAQGQALAVWIHMEGDRARLWARPYRAP
ncbi:hypothetical protein [Hydrogenophaga sp.]|uniref:hypothetical protein n=2 Tax=unclassified Hydrogenophaga TaxID=2610897 RepID=UPI002FCB3CDE